MAAHRYWRVNFTAITGSAGTSFAIAEIRMCTALAGASVCTGGTASAQSIFSGSFPASNACDNNLSTFWHSAGGVVPQWWKYDFGLGNDKDIIEIGLVPPDSRANQQPTAFTVEWSDDNSTWTTAWSVADTKYRGTASGGNQRRQPEYRFTNPAASVGKSYWRINVTNVDSATDTFGANELGFATSISGATVTTGGIGSASTQFNITTFASVNLFDANASTNYSALGTLAQAATDGYPVVAYYHWPTAQSIVEVIIKNRSDGGANERTQAPEAFTLESSTDGETWTTEWSKSGILWPTSALEQRFNNGGAVILDRRMSWIAE